MEKQIKQSAEYREQKQHKDPHRFIRALFVPYNEIDNDNKRYQTKYDVYNGGSDACACKNIHKDCHLDQEQ